MILLKYIRQRRKRKHKSILDKSRCYKCLHSFVIEDEDVSLYKRGKLLKCQQCIMYTRGDGRVRSIAIVLKTIGANHPRGFKSLSPRHRKLNEDPDN